MSFRATWVGAALSLLSGCGVVYTAPGVHDGAPYGDGYASDFDVAVVPMTYETTMAANLDPYVPARLPAAFQPGAFEAAMAAATPEDLASIPPATARPVRRPDGVTDALPPRVEPEPYRIGVGDVLLLAVRGPTTLEGLPGLLRAQANREGYVVQGDGAIAVPDAGRVRVGGMTLEQAEAAITEALFAANIDPEFSLEVAEFNSRRVAVGGLVGQPSLVPVTLQPLRLYEAIELAGGVAVDDPETTVIQIFRDGTIYRLGLDRYLGDPDARRIILRDGDSIHVGTTYREDAAQRYFDEQLTLRQIRIDARERSEAEARQRVADEQALFEKRLDMGAVERHYAFVTGEVRSPGEVVLPFERPIYLSNVLFGEKGGINIQTGDFGAIYVLRAATDPQQTGGLTAYHLDAENAANLAVATRFEIRPNDVVFVSEQPVTSWNRAISQILPQLILSLPRQVGSSAAAF